MLLQHLDECVVQMRACAEKLRSSKVVLSSALLDMKTRDVPQISKSRLVFDVEEKEQELLEKNKRKFEALAKQAEDQIEKLMAEKKQLEHELRRQSQQFREVLEERDADVQIEYNKMLSELNDHLEDAKQQLDSAIQLRDSKLDLVKDIPSTSHSLATEADLHEYQKLQRKVIARTNEVNELQAEFQALEEELARPLKRKADVLESIPDARERDAEECAKLQEEIKLLVQTEVNLKDQVNQRRLLDIQRAENEKMQREIQELEQEATNVQATLGQLSTRLQAQFRVLAPTSTAGALLTRLHSLVSNSSAPIPLSEFLHMSPNHEEGMRAVELLAEIGILKLENLHLVKL
ncbi:unnamed protein product [Aphanomyces euteiches]|nr:hypothetical protein Ae201684P_009915 [Aphanomyces euteiches]